MKALRLGDMRIDRIVEFERPFMAPDRLFPDATADDVDRHRHWLEPDSLDRQSGHLVLSLHSFLIRAPGLVVLVDACSGNHKPRPDKPRYHDNEWPYLQRLRSAGVEPEQVDFVLCTHLHVDHVGWNTRLDGDRWVPTFPRARYLFPRVEWEACAAAMKVTAEPPAFVADSIMPVFAAGQAQLVEGEHRLSEAIRLEPAPGHSPGQVCVHLRSGGLSAVMSADIMHHPLQCAEPRLSSSFCHEPDLAAATRLDFLRRHADTPTIVLPAHFPGPTAGRVVSTPEGYRFAFIEAAR